MTQLYDILADLNERRRQLGMSEIVVAQRADLSLSTVQRMFNGTGTPSSAALVGVASALGAKLVLKGASILRMQDQRASAKAEKLVRLVQGSSALEGQAVDRATRRQMVQRTKAELLAGSRRRLWATR